jgi:hypothetical protein
MISAPHESAVGARTTSPVQLTRALREFFLLEVAARRLAARSDELRRRLRDDVETAARTMLAAERVRSSELRLELAERALRTLIPAVAAAHESDAAGWPSLDAAIAHVASMPGAARHARALDHLKCSAGLSPASAAYEPLARAFAWLEARVDTRSARELWIARGLRPAAVIVALVLLGWQTFGARNLAPRSTLTASSDCGTAPPPALGKGPLSRLVDGRRHEASYAMCTRLEQEPWVTLDLGRARRIDEIALYSRSDCCWGRHDLPISVQLSLDNQEFATVATRSTPFSAVFPWRLDIDHTRARYVRLFSSSQKPVEIVLNELEVYGR